MREPVKVKTGSNETPKYRHTYRPLKYENEFANRCKTDQYPQGGS